MLKTLKAYIGEYKKNGHLSADFYCLRGYL